MNLKQPIELFIIQIVGTGNMESYTKKCPFCNTKTTQHEFLNIICKCGAKYYYADKLWLNRDTGERIKQLEENHNVCSN